VFKVNPADFPYHAFVYAADEAAFSDYVVRCKALSFYDTGVGASYGDKLITLSTCEYTQQGNRLVVVAKKVSASNEAGLTAINTE
jgi:sortase B